MFKFVMVSLGLAISAAPAMAAPTYLSCDLGRDGKSFIVKVTADEAEGAVAIYIPSTEYREKVRGAFTADKVLFETDAIAYDLSRVDLKIKQVTKGFGWVANGTCVVEQPPKRAF